MRIKTFAGFSSSKRSNHTVDLEEYVIFIYFFIMLSLTIMSCPTAVGWTEVRSSGFYARKQLLLSARLIHRSSVHLSVHLSVTRVDQSKTVQARITKFSPSAAWKTLVSGTVKLFHKFEGGHPKRGC